MQIFDVETLKDGIESIDNAINEALLLCAQKDKGEEVETEYILKALPKLSRFKLILSSAVKDLESVSA